MAHSQALTVVRQSVRPAVRTAAWLLSIMIPVSLAVTLLSYFGVMEVVAAPLSGAFQLIGLPGEAAVVFLTSIVLNIYSAIAVIGSLDLGPREITILALMCLIAHNFFVEIPVVRRTGSRPIVMIAVRLGGAVVGAVCLNLLLPGRSGADGGSEAGEPGVSGAAGGSEAGEPGVSGAAADEIADGLVPVLADWAVETLVLIGTVIGIIVALMILTRLLEHFGVIRRLSALTRPIFRVFGLPENAAFLWFVANTLGLAYGAAVMIEHVESGKLDRPTADLLNTHLVLSHSLLEDTLLFVAIGVGAGWIILPRIGLATVAVWLRRLLGSRTQEQSGAGNGGVV